MHADSPHAPPTLVRRRILLVEDNPDSRETLQMVLEAWGHCVQVAGDGEAGVSKALAWKPDVAVVDIGLPVLDGYQLARQVRSALGEGILLIALTGYSRPEDRLQAREAGFDVHLSKPADLDELARLVRNGTSGV
jgi:CheY-like chemotaxis protein